jgi:hypothetical protein
MPSNSRSTLRQALRADTTTTAGTTVQRGSGVVPSRLLRLNRALAALTEQAPLRSDRHTEDDPWPEVPEELEPVDEDPVQEDDLVYIGERRRRPVITFSRVSFWAPPDDAVPADPYAVDAGLRITIYRPAIGWSDDPWTSEIVGDELQRIAAALDHLQARALRAQSREEAYVRLERITQKTLAAEAEVDESTVSRRRREIIEAPWGLAPLEFFWWKRDRGIDLIEAQLLVQLLRSDPGLEDRGLARRVAEKVASPTETVHRTDAIRKQVPVMRSLLPLLPTLNLLSEALAEFDLEELDSIVSEVVRNESGNALDKRGRGLVRLALAGAFTRLEEQP